MADDKLGAATHLYVRFRRFGGRTLDVTWMVENAEYAREVLRLARDIPDDELAVCADRFEKLMFGSLRRAPASRASAASAAEGGSSRYLGSLR